MITDIVNADELFISLDETWVELLQLISSASPSIINMVPFKDSWTIAQLATHVMKSNKAIAQGLNMEGKPSERNPEEGVEHLKKMFLDFTIKFKSPEFIVPEEANYTKEDVIAEFLKSIELLKEAGTKVRLSEIINLPVFGEITKLELLHFVWYHTKRHTHQLKIILDALRQEYNN